jgi:hypothetical protein
MNWLKDLPEETVECFGRDALQALNYASIALGMAGTRISYLELKKKTDNVEHLEKARAHLVEAIAEFKKAGMKGE